MFITHAHYDRAGGFQFPVQKKYSTKETKELYEADTAKMVGNWQEVRRGRRVKVGNVEIEAHDAGHVLGSVQYEVIAAEGNLVFTGHINFTDTLLTRAAEVAPCDTLIVDTGFTPRADKYPRRESVIADIVKWSLDCVKERRIPAFETEPLGNAQELVKAFNTWTELPVIVHPRIARICKVYENSGFGLRYVDASTEEAASIVRDANCVVIVPRRFDTSRFGDFKTATVSAFPRRIPDTDAKGFALSDRADLAQLLEYVEETKPKNLIALNTGGEIFTQMVTRKLGIPAQQLHAETMKRTKPEKKLDESRVIACGKLLANTMQTRELTYDKSELLALCFGQGFREGEVEEALARLTRDGVLKFSELTDGYTLA